MNYDNLTDLLLEELNGYKPIKLPYNFNSLEPYIDEETMKLHFNKHYKGYIKKLNLAVGTKKMELKELVEKSSKRKPAIRNNAGGAYNHQLFWNMMSPERPSIKGNIKELLEKQYGTIDKFKEQFKEQLF